MRAMPSRLIKVQGHVYQLVEAQHDEYDAMKTAILSDAGELTKLIEALKNLAGRLMTFGEALSNDDPRFVTIMSSKLNEDARTSSVAYDLGDAIAKVERMADKAFRAMPSELRNKGKAQP